MRGVLVRGVLPIGVGDWLNGLLAGIKGPDPELRGLFAGEAVVGTLGVASSERDPGIGKNTNLELRSKIIFLAQPRQKSV